MMTTNIFEKYINFIFDIDKVHAQGGDINALDFVDIIASSDICLQFIQESEEFLNNEKNHAIKQQLISLLIYNIKNKKWGLAIFHNNKIQLFPENLDQYLVKFFRCWIFKALMEYMFIFYKLDTHNILIFPLEGRHYPDLIIIDKSINYQDLDWKQLQELTYKNNQYGLPLVYLSSVFILPDHRNSAEYINKLLNLNEVFAKLWLTQGNHIIVLTKKDIQFYTFNIRETKKLYDIRENDLGKLTEEELVNKLIKNFYFVFKRSCTLIETIELLNQEFDYNYICIIPPINLETKIFIDLLHNNEQHIITEYLKNNYYQIDETFMENENYNKKRIQDHKFYIALGKKMEDPVEETTPPKFNQAIKTLVKQSQQEIPLLHQTEFNLRQQLFIIFIYHIIQELYPEQTVNIENINVEASKHFIEVQYNNKNIIIFTTRCGIKRRLLRYIFLYCINVFIREVLFITEKEIIWIQPKEIERLTRCVKTEIKINKKVNGEWKQEKIEEQEEEFYEHIRKIQLEIITDRAHRMIKKNNK